MDRALFDSCAADPREDEDPFLAIEGRHYVHNPIEVDEAGDVDEFGTVRGAAHALKNTDAKRKASPNHHARAMALLEEMHPGCMLYVCEKRVTKWSGMVVKVDQWGFLDICGMTAKGAWIGCNVTTTAAMGAHMREYINPSNTHGQGQVPVIQLLEGYLARHGVFYIIGYAKVGSRWQPTVWNVDQALINEYKARRRS